MQGFYKAALLALTVVAAEANGQWSSVSAGSSSVYKCVDEAGHVTYQGIACPVGGIKINAPIERASSSSTTSDEELAARRRIMERHERARAASRQRKALPDYSPETHCREVASQFSGYSNQLYNTCISQQQDAYRSAASIYASLPSNVQEHCANVGNATPGGSYQILNTCLQQESRALNRPEIFSR